MGKAVVTSYLMAQGVMYYLILLTQSIGGDVVDVVSETNSALSLLNLEHPALGVLGQIIYVSMIWHRQLELKDSGMEVKTWSNNQSRMLMIRIFLSVVFSSFASMILLQLGEKQSVVNFPPGMGDFGIYLVDVAIGYFVIRSTKIEFENKVAEKFKDKFTL